MNEKETLLHQIAVLEEVIIFRARACADLKGEDISAIESEMRRLQTEMDIKTRQLLKR